MAISPIQQQRRSCLALVLLSISVLLLVGAIAFGVFSFYTRKSDNAGNGGHPGSTSTPVSTDIITTPTGEHIGISNGTYAFDTNRLDGNLKRQAADKLKAGDISGAKSLWQQAIHLDTNDAEALIYQEDQSVLDSKAPYITLVVGTTLSGGPSALSTGRDNLQGAYVTQKYYNDGLKLQGGMQILLLIASAGSKPDNATTVAEQIVRVAKQDHIVGVMGWPFSSYALNALGVLAKAHIPMVSPTASSDELTGKSFFFRVAPSNKSQAALGVQYAIQQLHATRVALFVDPQDVYSKSLAQDFSDQFTANGKNQIVATEQYTVGKPQMLPSLLQEALNANPDLIYFAGYADDMGVMLTDLGTSRPDVQVMGGDALYELGGYPSSSRAGFIRLRFTAFAYPDEWNYPALVAQKPPFFSIYAQDFDPEGLHTNSPYGYLRPDNDVILSYDATLALLQGCQNALTEGSNPITPDALQKGLTMINGSQAIQGVSGQISFASTGDPINKAVVVLYVDADGHIKLPESNGIQGCFLVACSSSQ